jgi:uncharacterized protein (TIGR02118 family)
MLTSFVTFDFKSADRDAEEKNYLGHHVPLVCRMPGLRMYLIAKARAAKDAAPSYYRAAILSFDSAAAMAGALEKSPVAEPLRTDREGHLTIHRWLTAQTETIVPMDSLKPGQDCFTMAAEFDLKLNGGDLAAAEKRYLEHHTHIARRLPGLRGYFAGPMLEYAGVAPDRLRMAIIVFDNVDAFRAAYRSPVGQELLRDEEATILNPRVDRLDATVQL